MSFSEVYNEVLSPFSKKFSEAANKKLKNAVLKDAADAVRESKLVMEVAEDLPKDLEMVCFSSFS